MSHSDISRRLTIYLDSHGATVRRRDRSIGCQDSFRPYYRRYWHVLETHQEKRERASTRWVMGTQYRLGLLGDTQQEWTSGTPTAIVKAFLVALRNAKHGRTLNLHTLLIAPHATSSWGGPATLYRDAWEVFADLGVSQDDQQSVFDALPCGVGSHS
jgi:hypothetical protein